LAVLVGRGHRRNGETEDLTCHPRDVIDALADVGVEELQLAQSVQPFCFSDLRHGGPQITEGAPSYAAPSTVCLLRISKVEAQDPWSLSDQVRPMAAAFFGHRQIVACSGVIGRRVYGSRRLQERKGDRDEAHGCRGDFDSAPRWLRL
jgi:hypothetical protein